MIGRINAEDLLDNYFVNEFQRRALCSDKALGCLQALLLKALREDPEFAGEVATCLRGAGNGSATDRGQAYAGETKREHSGADKLPGYGSGSNHRENSYQPSWQDSNSSRLRQAEQENERLKRENNRLEQENERLRNQVSELECRCGTLEKSNQELTKGNQATARRYAALESVYQSFHRLPADTQARLVPLFGADDPCAMAVALSNWNNVSQLWDFAKRRLAEGESALIADAVSLFTAAFAVFQAIRGTGNYELLQPRAGESFDYRYHSIMGCRTDGTISKVLLPGIVVQGQVKQKALVEVR